MVPLIVTFDVNGHFLSMYYPSIAAAGVLKPIIKIRFVNFNIFYSQFATKLKITYQNQSFCSI
jgi:hypothetical protein